LVATASDDGVLLFDQQTFDAEVIGHSVKPEIRRVVIAGIRSRRPRVLIVFVYAAPDRGEEPLADVSVDITASPIPLVAALDDRLGETQWDFTQGGSPEPPISNTMGHPGVLRFPLTPDLK
jgi:hypothetical protein